MQRAVATTKRRANYTCQLCRLKPKDRGFLHAHHLVSPLEGGPPADLANLVCLCQRCHLIVEDKTPRRTQFYWEQDGVKPPPRKSPEGSERPRRRSRHQRRVRHVVQPPALPRQPHPADPLIGAAGMAVKGVGYAAGGAFILFFWVLPVVIGVLLLASWLWKNLLGF